VIDGQDQIKRGVFWLGSATIAARVLDIAATLAVVSLLTQAQMGLAALALSASAILEALSGIGIGSALVQADKVTAQEESSLFWLTSFVGLGLGAILMGAAPLLSHVYSERELTPLVMASGLKLLFVGMSVVPLQLLSKHLKFKDIGVIQTLASLGEGVTKIAFALGGAGAWALVIGNVARGLVLVLALFLLSAFRPQLHFAIAETRRFVRFGLHVAGSGLLYHVYKNADYFLVGKLLGLDALGLYRVAFDVAMQPTDAIIVVVSRAGFPVYSRLAADLPALRANFLVNTRRLFLMVVPVAAFIFFAAGDVLQLLGRERWAASVPAVQILVWAGLLRAATVMFSQVYIAVGRPQYATLESAVTLLLLIGSFWLGLTLFPELGVLSVCFAWLLVYPLLLGWHLLLMRGLIGLEPLRYLRALATGLGPGPVMLVGLYLLREALGDTHGVLAPCVLAVAGLGIYAGYLRWVLKIEWRELLPARARPSVPLSEP
jgi:O-antigen/teichoic acid export membrane protein